MSSSHSTPKLAVVDSNADQLRLLARQLQQEGYSVLGYESPLALQKALLLRDISPDAIIMDLAFPEGEFFGAEVLQELAVQLDKQVPLVCISSRSDQQARLAAIRAGASAYLTKPLEISFLLGRLKSLLQDAAPYRVLIVDDQPILLQAYSEILKQGGITVKALNDPQEFLETYDAFQPDVTLLDIQMPEVSGLELASLLTEYRGLQRGGVIFLSGQSDPESQLQALAVGGDDFIPKPPDPETLVATVLTRARVARKVKEQGRHLQQVNQRLERLYQDRERQHEALNRHAIVSIADARGLITYVNDLFCQVSGYQPEELIGQNHRLLKSGQHSPEFYQEIWTTISAGLVWQGEVCNRRKDGRFYWVESTITPFFDLEGRIREYVSIRTDITRTKQIEQEYKQLAWDRGERIKEAQCLAQVMHAITNERLDETALLSEAAHLIPLGWKNPEHTWVRIDYAGASYTSTNFRQTHCLQEVEYSVVSAGESAGTLRVQVFTDETFDQELGAEACRLFLPEEKELLEQLGKQLAEALGRRLDRKALVLAKQEADRANKAKSNFLSSMSHELRTPMNAILGFAQMLEYDEALDEDQRDSAHEIIKAGKHLLALINDVLDLAKIEAGKVSLSMEQVDLQALAGECCPLLRPLADKRGIQLEPAFIQGQQVQADRVRLKQVLLNLCSNAIKYNKEGGQVRVDAVPQPDGWLRIRVTDTGWGIPEEALATLAQPFNRLNHETSNIEGTGIGLTITKKLVGFMQGRFGVESQVDQGSMFWVELKDSSIVDLQEAEAKAEQELTAQIQLQVEHLPEQTLKILSIDDNPANLKLIEQALKKRPDIQVISAHLPSMGIELAMADKPDVILLDVNMPGMDGYQVLQVLRSDPQLKQLPVIALTANALPSELRKGQQAGFNDYLTKPLDIELLNAAIDACLNKEPKRALE